MATKRFCDRCDKEIKVGFKYYTIELFEESQGYGNSKEICSSCKSSYDTWWQTVTTKA